MRSLLAAIFAFCLLGGAAQAASYSNAFTNSHLISYDSNFSAARTVSNNEVNTPDMNFKSDGRATTEISLDNKGISEIYQSLYFYGSNYASREVIYSTATGTDVKDANSNLSGTVKTTTSLRDDNTKVESNSSGLAMASPGSDQYELTLSGGHNTVTNAAIRPIPREMIPGISKEYTVTFESYPLELGESSADYFNEEVVLDFGVSGDRLGYYAYDFSRTILVDDVTCRAEMNYIKLG